MVQNNSAVAKKWLDFVAARPEFPRGARLLQAFDAGEITRLCDCGCNSFDLAVSNEAEVEPIAVPGARGGVVFHIEFSTQNYEDAITTLSLLVFVSKDGQLCGIDVDYCGNSLPVPESVVLKEPPLVVEKFEGLLP